MRLKRLTPSCGLHWEPASTKKGKGIEKADAGRIGPRLCSFYLNNSPEVGFDHSLAASGHAVFACILRYELHDLPGLPLALGAAHRPETKSHDHGVA